MPGSLLLEKRLLSASGRRRTPHVQATSMSVPYTALKFEDFASASPGEELQPLQEKFSLASQVRLRARSRGGSKAPASGQGGTDGPRHLEAGLCPRVAVSPRVAVWPHRCPWYHRNAGLPAGSVPFPHLPKPRRGRGPKSPSGSTQSPRTSLNYVLSSQEAAEFFNVKN